MTSNHSGASGNSPRHAANQTKLQPSKSSSGDLSKRVEKQLSMSEKHVRKLPAVTLQSPSKTVGSVGDYGRSPSYYKQKSLPARGENSTEMMENGTMTILPGQPAPAKPAKADYRNNQVLFTRYRVQRRKEYYVHPEWLSESITVQRLNLTDREEKSHWFWKGLLNSAAGSTETYPPPGRRSRSVPPPESGVHPPLSPVNPITWR